MNNQDNNMKSVIASYENYDEDFRLVADNAHNLEFITAVTYMDRIIPQGSKIIDTAAGTGIYALHYAKKGFCVTALDITPSYIEKIIKKSATENLHIPAFVNDARDLSVFADHTFDACFCMGPIYHLTEIPDREKVLSECLRILKPGGTLFLAYINKHFVFTQLSLENRLFLQDKWFEKIIMDGKMYSDDKDCFWTDTWFTTPSEIEGLINRYPVEILHHIAQDGIGRLLSDSVNNLRPEYFERWKNYHLATCEEPSLLGISNHGLVIVRKKIEL